MENQVVVVVAIKKTLIIITLGLIAISAFSQDNTSGNGSSVYKKRVLESIEIDILSSYYTQDGSNAAVTGGIGTEELDDFATNINISIPLNADDVLTIDGSISAYTSASSSNLNPFSGASSGDDGDDKRDGDGGGSVAGTPWISSSGASKHDTWSSGNIGYSHSSDDRNNIWSANINFASEYDYTSYGVGGSFTKLFNQQNTEIGIKTNIYLDAWKPAYPTEVIKYIHNDGDLFIGFFQDVDILDSLGIPVDKTDPDIWHPISNTLIEDKGRDTYSVSLSFSQILGQNSQISVFSDIVMQKGWLANPMQRVYFADKDNYFIGNADDIPNYTSPSNSEVFQLADDIERLPDSRLKTPIGMRFNYYINEFFVLRNYYRYYFDDWGIKSHTANIEVPIKITDSFTLYPSYRYYTQTESEYFAPFDEHLSTDEFYTSDYDLSEFNSSQFGFEIQYNDIFTKAHLGILGLKTINLNYSYYKRNTGLNAHIISLGVKFILNK